MASSDLKESAANNPGLQATPDEATKGYFMQQTMFRIKDPKASLDFYSRVLGMSLLKRVDFPDMKFTLYFLGYEDVSEAPSDSVDRTVWTFGRPATIELTHNWGTESDPEFKGYHNGNSEPRGFGYRAPEVTDTRKATQASDVYSFRVFLLELLTGRLSIHATGGEEIIHLVRWVHSVVREEWTVEVFDEELYRYPNIENEMVEMLQIAMGCVVREPEQRPKMGELVKIVEEIRRANRGNQLSFETKSETSTSTSTAPL